MGYGVTGLGNPANQTTNTGRSGASSAADAAEFSEALNQASQRPTVRSTTPNDASGTRVTRSSGGKLLPLNPNIGQRVSHGGGFFLKGGSNQMVAIDGALIRQKGTAFHPNQAHDTTSYFDGRVRVHHQGEGINRQYTGAPLPATPANPLNVLSNQTPTRLGYKDHLNLRVVPGRRVR